MWILISILVALGSLFGYNGTYVSKNWVHSAASHSAQAAPSVFYAHAQSGSGPVGSAKL